MNHLWIVDLVLLVILAAATAFLLMRLRATEARARASNLASLRLEQRILEISEEERRRIGHDLHDGLGQHLTAIALISESLMQRLTTEKHPSQERLELLSKQAEQVTQMVTQSIGWTRDLARGLSPLTLESDGLIAALEELSLNASKLFGINCDFDSDEERMDMDGQVALHLYRIVQEAISNSVRHGKAKKIDVKLETDAGLKLTVIDDGGGLSAKTIAEPGIGLRIMQYRARMIGASLLIERVSSAGGARMICSLAQLPPAPTKEAKV
jgi:signal transduction histidine kinase